MRSTITETLLALGQWVELSILGKATILLVAGLIAARLAGRARASVRHLLLATTFATLLALPLIVATAPAVEIPISPANDSHAAEPAALPAPRPSTRSAVERPIVESSRVLMPSWPTILRLGWITGALLLLVPLATNLWRLRRIRRDGLPWLELSGLTQSLATASGIHRTVEVLRHEDILAPLTCGVWRPAIVLPADAQEWSEADLHRALLHELEHVRRGDWAIQLMARVACACYWFHPLVWVASRRLCLEAERACDDAVVQTAERADYAEQLVSLAQRLSKAHNQAALGMANRSDLSARVSALLDNNQRRGRAGLLAAASALIVASLTLLAIAPVRTIAQSRNAVVAAISESVSTANDNIKPRSNDTQAPLAASEEPSAQAKDKPGRRSAALDLDLYDAAENGDLSDIERLLNAGANVNCALDGDGSPLIAAARSGHLAAVRLLLDRGANPNLAVPGDGNPLIMAAREGHEEVVALLLDRGASIDQMVPDDENALIQASGNGHLKVVKLLVARGANVNARAWAEQAYERPKGEWRTPLNMARKGRHEAVVAFLLAAGARE